MLPANRIAAIAAFLTSLATALTGLAGSLPTTTANAITAGVGVIGVVVTCLHFMSGSQKQDAHNAQTEQAKIYAAAQTPPRQAVALTPILAASGNTSSDWGDADNSLPPDDPASGPVTHVTQPDRQATALEDAYAQYLVEPAPPAPPLEYGLNPERFLDPPADHLPDPAVEAQPAAPPVEPAPTEAPA